MGSLLGLLLAAPRAGAGGRDPLPALRVERPLTTPRGWCLAAVGAERRRPASDETLPPTDPIERRDALSASLRYGLLPRVELRVEGGLAARHTNDASAVGPDDPLVGARWSVWRREAPSTSVAADLSWRAPYGAAPAGVPVAPGVGALGAAMLGTQQLGPVLLSGRAGVAVRPARRVRWRRDGGPFDAPDGASAGAGALIQLGPIAPSGRIDAEWWGRRGRSVEAELGLGVQLTRGLAVDLAAGGPIGGSVPHGPAGPADLRGPRSRLGIEVAF